MPHSRFDRKYGITAGLFTIVAALVPSAAHAEPLCRCTQPALSATICTADLTARIKVLSEMALRDGSYAYLASVEATFQGDAESYILIEAPRGCGFALRSGRRYLASLSLDARTGLYTASACTSYVREWNKLSHDEQAVLEEPTCGPRVAQEGEVCYRFDEGDPAKWIQRECAEGLRCVNTSTTFGFNSIMYCVAESEER